MNRWMVVSSCWALLLLAAAPPVMAQSGPELLLKPWDKDGFVEMRADILLHDDGEFEDDGEEFKLTTWESEGRIRILPGNIASPRLGYDVMNLNVNTDLPGFPEHLTDQSAAAGLLLAKFESGWIMGLTVGGGYAGESEYRDANGWYFKGTLVFGREVNENNALAVVVDYDRNRVIFPDVPLVGFAWVGKLPERNLQLTLGFPINSVLWEINERTKAEATWTFSDSFDARVSHQLSEHWSVLGRVETRWAAFHLDELEDGNDRLFFTQRRAEAGVLWMPGKYVSLLAAAGYAFAGEFSTGWDSRDLENVAEISDEPYVRVGVELRF